MKTLSAIIVVSIIATSGCGSNDNKTNNDFQERENSIELKANELKNQEQAVKALEKEVLTKESELSELSIQLNDKEQKLNQRELTLIEKESQIKQEKERVEQKIKCIDLDQTEICTHPHERSTATIASSRSTEGWIEKALSFSDSSEKKTTDVIWLGASNTSTWLQRSRGLDSWNAYFSEFSYNIGIGGDATQNILWRIEMGNLKDANPSVVALLVGTNNINAKHTEKETADGIAEVLSEIRFALPSSEILLIALSPYGQHQDDEKRIKTNVINNIISDYNKYNKIHYIDIWNNFINEQGEFIPELTTDYIHLTPAGFKLYAELISPKIEELRSL